MHATAREDSGAAQRRMVRGLYRKAVQQYVFRIIETELEAVQNEAIASRTRSTSHQQLLQSQLSCFLSTLAELKQ